VVLLHQRIADAPPASTDAVGPLDDPVPCHADDGSTSLRRRDVGFPVGYPPVVLIRAEKPADFDEIDDVVRAAFGKQDEVDLVHRIRSLDTYVPHLALVAAHDDGTITGHVMLSYADLGGRRVLQLAPLAVRPERHGQGIGGALTRAALELADERGEPLVLVLGHPGYYPRFGFESARARGIVSSIEGLPDEPWMVKLLTNYDPSLTGTATFPAGA
jgi:putative acetyltransferase